MNIVAEGTVERLKGQLKREKERTAHWKKMALALGISIQLCVLGALWLCGLHAKSEANLETLLNAEEQHSAELQKSADLWQRREKNWRAIAVENGRLLFRCRTANPKWSEERP